MKNPLNTQNFHLGAQTFLKILTIGTTMAATWLMMTSKEIAIVYGLPFEAKYSYVSAFKFFSYANAIACGLTAVSLLFLFIFGRRGLTPSGFFVLFLHDLCLFSLVLSGVAAATAIGMVGQFGNSHAGWMPICDNLYKFCKRVKISSAFGYCSVILLLLLSIMAASKSKQIQV